MSERPAPTPRHRTLISALAQAAASDQGLCFIDAQERDTELSFATLHRRARRAAGALRERGVRRGDRVALVHPTSPGFVEAFFGILLAGAVPVPLYPPVRLGRMDEYHLRTARMLLRVEASLVISEGRVRRLLGQAVERARPALGCCDVAELSGAGAAELEDDPAPDDLALIQFSSGTTVDPKPVALSHRGVLANVAMIDQLFPPSLSDAGVSWLPLYHDMGLVGCLLLSVCHPGPLTLIPPELFLSRPAIWLRTLSRKRGTVSPAPNFAFGLCVKRIRDEELEGVDLSRWRLALNGAEPISPAVMRAFTDRFAPHGFEARALTPVYGLSEATLAVTFSEPERLFRLAEVDPVKLAAQGEVAPGRREVVSVGRPLPGMELELRGPDGAPVPEGRVGRIHVRGPSVMTGYFRDPEATAQVLAGGWLDTGDLGFVMDGELYVSGRAKDVVILRGKNHPPQEFEECLDGLPGLRAGCAVAIGVVPEGSEGEELFLLAERDSASAPVGGLEDRIRAAVVDRTAIRPHGVLILEPGTLPRTSSGKLRRAEAKRQLLAGELASPGAVNAFTLAVEVVRSQVGFLRAKLPP